MGLLHRPSRSNGSVSIGSPFGPTGLSYILVNAMFIGSGLKDCMSGYSYVESIEELLHSLKDNNYEMQAFTNYPIWKFCFVRYEMNEDKLNISKYFSSTFCSCISRKRKPDPEFYLEFYLASMFCLLDASL
ncbi:PREDICTED: uncharacterized protein LOC103318877 [Prunus mume]|uniref:Uncharacterized protein LOC103318877 n=1 Tax=Prunus mume TaxID=102107 RepID=A0ABM0N2H0_PRUMU|nr:PREDICTED: uncharacterized protein LOC103318877 [Prunus mume]